MNSTACDVQYCCSIRNCCFGNICVSESDPTHTDCSSISLRELRQSDSLVVLRVNVDSDIRVAGSWNAKELSWITGSSLERWFQFWLCVLTAGSARSHSIFIWFNYLDGLRCMLIVLIVFLMASFHWNAAVSCARNQTESHYALI